MGRKRRGKQLNLGTVPLSVYDELEKKVDSDEFTTVAAAGKYLLREGTQRWKEQRISEEEKKQLSILSQKMKELDEKESRLTKKEEELEEREGNRKKRRR